MMSFGIIAKNSAGYSLIDGEDIQYEVIREGSGPCSSSFFMYYTLPSGAFIVGRNNGNHYMDAYSTPNSLSVAFISTTGNYGGTFEYKVLAPIVTVSTDTYGVRVRNGSNLVTFDSGKRYLGVGAIVTNSSVFSQVVNGMVVAPAAFVVSLPYVSTGYWVPLISFSNYLSIFFDEYMNAYYSYTACYTTTNSIVFGARDNYLTNLTPGGPIADYVPNQTIFTPRKVLVFS